MAPDYCVSPGMAAMHRRAAALYLHFRDEGDMSVDGLMAILDEMDHVEEVDGDGGSGDVRWVALVIALLDVGCQMAAAAVDRAETRYLEDVVRAASVAEIKDASDGAGDG